MYVSAHGGGLEKYAGTLCGGEGTDRGEAEFPTSCYYRFIAAFYKVWTDVVRYVPASGIIL